MMMLIHGCSSQTSNIKSESEKIIFETNPKILVTKMIETVKKIKEHNQSHLKNKKSKK